MKQVMLLENKPVPELFITHPAVFAVGDSYQIMLPVMHEALLSVKCGGEEFFDDCNGIIRSKCAIHRVLVPMAVLDAAGEYTVCCRPVVDRKPYFPETESMREYIYSFRPLRKMSDIRVVHLSDTHGMVDEPICFAQQCETPDLLVVNGDVADHSGNEENMLVLYRLVSAITGGEFPCVFSRGNHDLRGALAERLVEFTPNDAGHSYYTFRVGCIWGLVLDCSEDKNDDCAEYGHTVCCHAFRRRVTRFLKQVIAHAAQEYAADGVQYRLVVSHVPFTCEDEGQFRIESALYAHWVALLREYVRPQLMLCGHKHGNAVWMPGSAQDSHGQTWPVVVASLPDMVHKRYAGAMVTLQPDCAAVRYADSDGKRLDEYELTI